MKSPKPSGLVAAASLGRLHIVGIAFWGALTFGWVLTGARPWAAAAIGALDWFLVNLLNRVVDVEEDRLNQVGATAFVARHRRLLAVGAGLTLAGSLVWVHLAFPALTPWRLGYHLLGAAYNWPLLPGRLRLKQLYFWKNAASATGFLLTVFAYPLSEGGSRLPLPGLLLIAAFFFALELSYEIIYDLRDLEGDRAVGVRTYPVVHGARGAMRIIDALLAASVGILGVGFALGAVPWRGAVMAVAPLVQLAYYKHAARRGITSGDCIRLTWLGSALLVAYQLWTAAGLPGS